MHALYMKDERTTLKKYLAEMFPAVAVAVRVNSTWYHAAWSGIRLAHKLVPITIDPLDKAGYNTFMSLPRVAFQDCKDGFELV